MIVTIDGPAGAGKSSASRKLARRLGFRFLDTGAMYRAVTLAAMRRNLDWQQPRQLAELAARLRIEVGEERVLLDGDDVTEEIRKPAVTELVHHAADNQGVRDRLVVLQRQAVAGASAVSEGRDQGTVVFPDAECKIFLTASPEERARRRQQDLANRGQVVELAEVLKQQNQRDRRDTTRPVGALRRADEAVEIVTDGMSPDEVVDHLEAIVRARVGG